MVTIISWNFKSWMRLESFDKFIKRKFFFVHFNLLLNGKILNYSFGWMVSIVSISSSLKNHFLY